MPAERRIAMKNRAVAIFVAACGVALAAGVVYADLKKRLLLTRSTRQHPASGPRRAFT